MAMQLLLLSSLYREMHFPSRYVIVKRLEESNGCLGRNRLTVDHHFRSFQLQYQAIRWGDFLHYSWCSFFSSAKHASSACHDHLINLFSTRVEFPSESRGNDRLQQKPRPRFSDRRGRIHLGDDCPAGSNQYSQSIADQFRRERRIPPVRNDGDSRCHQILSSRERTRRFTLKSSEGWFYGKCRARGEELCQKDRMAYAELCFWSRTRFMAECRANDFQ